MTIIQIIALCLLPVIWFVLAGLNKDHVETTGVAMPSRKAMARIRRNARQKGISQSEAYDQWLANKQKRQPKKNKLTLPDVPYTPTYNQSDPTEAKTGSSRSFANAFPAAMPPLKDADPLAISIKSMKPRGDGSTLYDFDFDFHCKDCGGYVISVDDADHRVTCKACDRYLGELPAIKVRCEEIAHAELRSRGLMQDPPT